MTETLTNEPTTAVILWLDPVCPFSWHTARWLNGVAAQADVIIDWQLMSLAILNEGREMPPPQQARMDDSRRVGRLMAAIGGELGERAVAEAYFAFGAEYFDRSVPLSDDLIDGVLTKVGARQTTAAAAADTALDAVVARSHQASQEALGDTGGSPMLSIGGHTFFGPVLTAVPSPEVAVTLFEAVATLAAAPQFTQLQRPRAHH